MNEKEKTSIKALREELSKLDTQIENTKFIQRILEEERKPYYQVYTWEAPERVQPTQDKRYYLAGSATALFFVVLSLLTNNFGLVIAIIALVVLIYAMSTVPPQKAIHEITNKGLSLFSTLYSWRVIENFWITERGGNKFFNLEIKPKEDKPVELIVIPLGDGDLTKIVPYMSQFVDYLPETEIQNGWMKSILDGRILTFREVIEKPS